MARKPTLYHLAELQPDGVLRLVAGLEAEEPPAVQWTYDPAGAVLLERRPAEWCAGRLEAAGCCPEVLVVVDPLHPGGLPKRIIRPILLTSGALRRAGLSPTPTPPSPGLICFPRRFQVSPRVGDVLRRTILRRWASWVPRGWRSSAVKTPRPPPYERFRTGLVYRDVWKMLWVDNPDPATWVRKSRGVVLRLHAKIKQDLYAEEVRRFEVVGDGEKEPGSNG